MDAEHLYAQAIKYLMSRDYIITPTSIVNGIRAYSKDSIYCTLGVFYWRESKGHSVAVWKTDTYPEDCRDYEALVLMGCKAAETTLKSFIVETKPAESYIPTWVQELF